MSGSAYEMRLRRAGFARVDMSQKPYLVRINSDRSFTPVSERDAKAMCSAAYAMPKAAVHLRPLYCFIDTQESGGGTLVRDEHDTIWFAPCRKAPNERDGSLTFEKAQVCTK